LMNQPTGHCYIKLANGDLHAGQLPQPRQFYVMPEALMRLTHEFYARHNLAQHESDRLLAQRHQDLLAAVKRDGKRLPVGAEEVQSGLGVGQATVRAESQSIWNR